MFNWLWKRILSDDLIDFAVDKAINRGLDVIQSEEFAKAVIPLTDALYQRYYNKVASSIGGTMKGVNYDVQQQNPLAFLGKGGKINWMQILGMFLQSRQGQQQIQTQTGEENPFPASK